MSYIDNYRAKMHNQLCQVVKKFRHKAKKIIFITRNSYYQNP